MSKIILGKSQEGKIVEIDLKVLLRTRLLVQAASGGGKSQTLRRLAEQFFGKVPVWIIDRNDEFPSLRDKFGYVFAGPGGETPIDPRSAELVCEKLLKAKASAIFGLYTLKDPDRHLWTKLFLDALMNAPKSLWTHLVVFIDEAHKLCPEKGQGESVAKEVVTDLAVDGRKRGFCAGFYTQRLGKLSKNASAELLNRMVGKTIEDIDVDRASDLMSVRRQDRQEFEEGIKKLPPGNFWCFGEAISTNRILVHVGGIQTKHPEPGEPELAPPPLPEKMKALLPQLADLPKEAEQKARTEAEVRKENQALRAQIATLGRQLQATPKIQTFTKPVVETKVETKIEIKEVPVLQASEVKAVEKLIIKIERLRSRFQPLVDFDHTLTSYMDGIGAKLSHAVEAADNFRKPPVKTMTVLVPKPSVPMKPVLRNPATKMEYGALPPVPTVMGAELSDLQLRQLTGLLDFERIGIPKVARKWLAGWLGMSLSGHFKNNFYGLQKRGLIVYEGDRLLLTAEGRQAAPPSDLEITTKSILDRCTSAVEDLSGRQLRHLHAVHPNWVAREDLANELLMSLSGHFKNCFYDLHKAGMIEYGSGENRMKLKCADWLFVGEGVAV